MQLYDYRRWTSSSRKKTNSKHDKVFLSGIYFNINFNFKCTSDKRYMYIYYGFVVQRIRLKARSHSRRSVIALSVGERSTAITIYFVLFFTAGIVLPRAQTAYFLHQERGARASTLIVANRFTVVVISLSTHARVTNPKGDKSRVASGGDGRRTTLKRRRVAEARKTLSSRTKTSTRAYSFVSAFTTRPDRRAALGGPGADPEE